MFGMTRGGIKLTARLHHHPTSSSFTTQPSFPFHPQPPPTPWRTGDMMSSSTSTLRYAISITYPSTHHHEPHKLTRVRTG